MKDILKSIKKHSCKIAKHVNCHKHHYVMGGFASFAVFKAILLVAGGFGALSLTNASFADPVTACAQVTEIPSLECEALLAVYNNTDGNNRTKNTYWGDIKNISKWYGINVADGHVNKIMLGENNLVGSIPSEIGNLKNLERLDVYNNQIDSIPSEIENLVNLKYFYIYNNELTILPPEIVRLVNLEGLYLNGNKLTTLPLEMAHFTKLVRLNLSNNRLTSLPAELEYLTNLEYLNIKNNDIDTTSLSSSMNDFIASKVGQDRETTQCSVQRDCTSVYYNDLCGPCSAEALQAHGSAHGSAQQTEENITDATYSPDINSAYQWAYQVGITTMPTIQTANIESGVIRSELAKMITEFAMKILDKQPDVKRNCTFDDIIQETEETQFYIKNACQLGLMGIDMIAFEPNNQATRAEVGTVISRALYGTLHNGGTPYYLNHLNALKAIDIISDTNPDVQELRGYIMLMLWRAAQKK